MIRADEYGKEAAQVHDAIVNQYRALRARDAVIDDCLVAEGQETSEQNPKRQEMVARITKPLHEWYVTTLSAYLTPEQVEIVKDKMTYNKVKVTFDAYCEIIPNLTDSEKTMIMDKLKAAREEAIDGGSADEKHAIFEQYKKQINAKLTADGHDVEKAFKDYEAKQGLAGASGANIRTN